METPLSDFPLPSTIWRVLITVRGYSAHVTPLNSAAPPTKNLRLSNFSQFTSPGGPGREGALSAAMAHAGTEISRRGDTPDASGDSRSTLSTSASVPDAPRALNNERARPATLSRDRLVDRDDPSAAERSRRVGPSCPISINRGDSTSPDSTVVALQKVNAQLSLIDATRHFLGRRVGPSRHTASTRASRGRDGRADSTRAV